MKQLSAEECLARILKDIEKRKTVDYADKNSVRRYNAAMDRIIERANYFYDNYPEKMNMFTELLDHPDFDIAETFTAVIYGLRNATKSHKLIALDSARQLLSREMNALNRYIWSLVIKQWEAQLQEM